MKTPLFLADAGARALTLFEPETAHRLVVRMTAAGFAARPSFTCDPRLRTTVAGIEFPNPLGLAAGFDKNAEIPDAMLDLGFGFVEVGGVTPRPQEGNERPRVFRLREDIAVVNRYGFNSDGLEAVAGRLERRPRRGVVGVNLGANKDSEDRIEDYVRGVRRLDGLVDFYTVNISSPNTPGLRALQSKEVLHDLLTRVLAARNGCESRAPVFLKIAPDLTDVDKTDIVETVRETGVDGLVVSNTTIARSSSLKSPYAKEQGGLSGAPLFGPSTALTGEFYRALAGAAPIIAVGGVFSARDAYRKILAGGALVQLYTALIYEGPGLVVRILKELPRFLNADGFSSISEAVGADAR